MSAAPRGSKLAKFLNSRVNVVIQDKRRFVGQLLAFDAHSNIVLKDCEEYRRLKRRKAGEAQEVKRNLGLMILRGETVLHVDVVGPPPPNGNRMTATSASAILHPGSTPEKAKPMTMATADTIVASNDSLSKPIPGVGSASSALARASAPVIPASDLPQ